MLLTFVFSNVGMPSSGYADDNENKQKQNTDSSQISLINPGKLTIAAAPPYPPFVEVQGNDLVGFEPDL